MKSAGKLFFLIVNLIVLSCSAAYSFDGPFQVRNQYPIFIHADEPFLDKAVMENSLSLSLSHSSTYTVQSSGHWDIYLDMEITEVNLRYKRIIKNFIEFDMDVPVLVFSSGLMDGFLHDYHKAFGFPDYGRSQRPLNELLYEVRRDGKLIVKGSSGIGLSDIRLALKKQLVSSDGFGLSIKADVELPTGSAKKGFGNGSIDAGVSLLLDKRITDSIMTYWNLGAVFPGNVRGYEKINLKNYIHGGAAIEAALSSKFSMLVQLQGQSAIYPTTDLSAVDRAGFLLVFGGRYSSGINSFDLSLSEDIHTTGAPDFILNLSYKMKM
ncbi:MAG: DUF3187 family protein [Nitrospirae bacterium]|nr:DUF3187 family protein [Nitrospirota bacterium]